MIIVGLPFTLPALNDTSSVHGGTPYGASAIINSENNSPTELELEIAKMQGKRVAEIAKKLFG
jgi:NAD(P)H dehydrogenase (quinone)